LPALKGLVPKAVERFILICYIDYGLFTEEIASMLGTSRRKITAVLVANGIDLKRSIGQKRKDREPLPPDLLAMMPATVKPTGISGGSKDVSEQMIRRVQSLAKNKKVIESAKRMGNGIDVEISYHVTGISSDMVKQILEAEGMGA